MKITSEVLSLIKKGISINQIRSRTGFAKSTIYYHYKKIKGRKIKRIKFNFQNEGELGEFLGIFAGDGSFFRGKNGKYVIRIYTGYYEEGYRKYLEEAFDTWFSKPPKVYLIKSEGMHSAVAFTYGSKQIYELLKEHLYWGKNKTHTVKLKEFDLQRKEFNLGFLRGLIDTDGNYYFPKRRLSFSSTSEALANQAREIINEQGITTNFRSFTYPKETHRAELYTLTLHGDKAHKVIKLIKPSNPNKRYKAPFV